MPYFSMTSPYIGLRLGMCILFEKPRIKNQEKKQNQLQGTMKGQDKFHRRQRVGKGGKFEVVGRKGDIKMPVLEDKTIVSDHGA